MKTFNGKTLSRLPYLLPFILLLFSSCENGFDDLRDELTGTYNYEVKLYVQDDNDLVYIGNQGDNYDLTGTMRVVKTPGTTDGIDFYDGNIIMFQGIHLKETENAIVFDVPGQEAWIGPGNVQIEGFDYVNVGPSGYHGAFFYEDDSFEIAFSARVMDADTGMVMVLNAWRD
jgi:hypothetical protein